MTKMGGLYRPACLGLAALLALVVAVAIAPSRPAPIKAAAAPSTGSWTTYHRDDAHTGNDPTLPRVASASAGWTSPALDDQVSAEPLVLNGVVYAGTLNGTVYALKQSDGTVLWSKN